MDLEQLLFCDMLIYGCMFFCDDECDFDEFVEKYPPTIMASLYPGLSKNAMP